MDFIRLLEEHREKEDRLRWEGSFAEYLELVRRQPAVARLAHARIYDMIINEGVEETGGMKKYRFFAKEIFGLDRMLSRLVEDYFHSASKRLEVRKRILLLMGPVSGGKSTIVSMLKRAWKDTPELTPELSMLLKTAPCTRSPST